MLEYFRKILRVLKIKKEAERQGQAQAAPAPRDFDASLDQNLAFFRQRLGDSSDIVIKEFQIDGAGGPRCALLLIDGLVDQENVNLSILKPMMYEAGLKMKADHTGRFDIAALSREFLSAGEVKLLSTLDEALGDLFSGQTILLVDRTQEALSIGLRKWEKRGVGEPQTETVVRGPREGFTETLRVNTAMLRRKIKNANLRLETMKIGRQTNTDVCIAYIEGIVKPGLIDELKKRLDAIDTDSVLDSGYVEAYIEDAPYSIFPTVGNSERPDTIAGRLLEGRAAVIVDGSPFVLSVPAVYIEYFQSPEDYYIRTYYASVLRIIRVFSFLITILAPALYVAITTFHQELIPTKLLFTMTAGLSGVPFPALVEALIMQVMFDILKEAGIRLPKPVGSAISIVGALVIGQSAVSAGLIGPFMIIVISITAISSFVVPAQTDSLSLMRYIFLLLAGFLGGFGVIMGLLFALTYLVSLKSFGTFYLSPILPLNKQGMKDCFVRMPLWMMMKRPFTPASENDVRRGPREAFSERKGG
ncbi:MAG TPA: spore germination protein [Clostridia bacterium]|nr:spore germination protein [Clostridia bacterium]HPK16353.1 spore germination protein [Clostridia bacterium]